MKKDFSKWLETNYSITEEFQKSVYILMCDFDDVCNCFPYRKKYDIFNEKKLSILYLIKNNLNYYCIVNNDYNRLLDFYIEFLKDSNLLIDDIDEINIEKDVELIYRRNNIIQPIQIYFFSSFMSNCKFDKFFGDFNNIKFVYLREVFYNEDGFDKRNDYGSTIASIRNGKMKMNVTGNSYLKEEYYYPYSNETIAQITKGLNIVIISHFTQLQNYGVDIRIELLNNNNDEKINIVYASRIGIVRSCSRFLTEKRTTIKLRQGLNYINYFTGENYTLKDALSNNYRWTIS
jgi:hypothetical protein